MSSTQYLSSIPIFQGNQGNYYVVDGYKYDIHFPLVWALDHKCTPNEYQNGSGPKDCSNCFEYGSINNVFVGYCSNCLRDVYDYKRGNHPIDPAAPINILSERELWIQFSYMNDVKISEIGDKNDPQETINPNEFYENCDEFNELDEKDCKIIYNFIEDAKDYHEKEMEKRIKNKKLLSPEQFRLWEITSGFGKTNMETRYESYLKTGNVWI
jgi:hypothetical protein